MDIFGDCGSKEHKCPKDGDQCFRNKEYSTGVTEAHLSSSHNAFSPYFVQKLETSCDFSLEMDFQTEDLNLSSSLFLSKKPLMKSQDSNLKIIVQQAGALTT